MKRAAIATVITLTLMVLLVLSIMAFTSSYTDSGTSIRVLLGDGMLLLSIIFATTSLLQIFTIWIFVSQVDNLRKYLEERANYLEKINSNVTGARKDLEMLL